MSTSRKTDCTLSCEKIDVIESLGYEEMKVSLNEVPLSELLAIVSDEMETDDIIEAVGLKSILDSIGKDACISHFGIEEATE